MPRLFTGDSICQSQAEGHRKYVHWNALCQVIVAPTITSVLGRSKVSVGTYAEITEYIMAHAKILFAVAQETNVPKLVPLIFELKLTDDYLPIWWDETPGRAKSLSGAPKNDPALSWFDYSEDRFQDTEAHEAWIDNFCRAQWRFLAPVFTDLEIVYPLHDESPLPFKPYEMEANTGANSFLIKAEIHPSHWKVIRKWSGNVTANGARVPVAIKMIKKEHEATDMWVQVEVAALELVRSLHNDHLINFLTSYRRDGNHYLIFDWADGGDLAEFWLKTSPFRGESGQPSHRDSIIWAVNQMAGLAEALYELHGGDKEGDKERVHCRHGDLKPANIVRSHPADDAKHEPHGHLRITDMGVAKINDKATHVGRSSGPVTVTIRYQSPEFLFSLNAGAATSRAYDVWSMGCILLEFIIWLLYGPVQLQLFNKSFPNTTFFTGKPGNVTLNLAVQRWVDHINKALGLDGSQKRCISKALRHIFDFLLKEVLIPDCRPELDGPDEAPVGQEAAIGNAPGIAISPALNDAAGRTGVGQHDVVANDNPADTGQNPPPNEPHTGVEAPPRMRAKSKALRDTLREAQKMVEANHFNALRKEVNGEQLLPPPPKHTGPATTLPGGNPVPAGGHLEAPQPDVQLTTPMLAWDRIKPQYGNLPKGKAHPEDTYLADYLRDSWDPLPDNDLALELFPELNFGDVVPANMILTGSGDVKSLCDDCSHEITGVFSLLFVRKETFGALRARETSKCGVCWMLLQHATRQMREAGTLPLDDVEFKFLRSGSYLMQSFPTPGRHDEPIFSLIAGPGVTATPKDLQRSLPMLPQLVTKPGREADAAEKPKPTMTVTGQEAKFTIMKKWLADCDVNHTAENKFQPNCNPKRPPMRLPTRLIYVGQGKSTRIHLDCEEDREKKDLKRYHKYIALSHRWGYPKNDPAWVNPDGTIKTFCTTDDNITQHKDPNRGIDFTTMPKTFRDAIEVTRGLGIRYIWIDSLCIIQDQPDNEDFNKEAGRMADVYSGAYCTIASTGAEGTTGGFLNERANRGCCRIETTRRAPSKLDPDSTQDKSCTVYICDAIDDFKADVNEAEMATRGWVFQERGLSRRTLHFGKKQMYWECGAGVCCETMTRMFNRKGTFMSDPDFPSQAASYNRGMKIMFYQALYQHYSGLGFSKMPNRAVAMESLEKKIFATFQTKGAYGVMDEFLHRTLLWQRQDRSPDGALTSIVFKKNDRTPPSWSWMGVEGKIGYLPVDFGTVDWEGAKTLSPFREAHCENGRVADNQLAPIKAVPRGINWDAVGDSPRSLILDCDEKAAGKIEGLKCVVMGTKKKSNSASRSPDLFGFRFPVLLVAPKTGNTGYKRVGVGMLEEKEMKEGVPNELIEIS